MEQSTAYTIQGTKVLFPAAKAYPSQLAMMNKVLLSLNHRQNCLIESPTGSGKSLALLCSALAWQKKHIEQAIDNELAVQTKEQEWEGSDTKSNKITENDSSEILNIHEVSTQEFQDLDDFKAGKSIEDFEFTSRVPGEVIRIDKPSLVKIQSPDGQEHSVFVKGPCVITPKRMKSKSVHGEPEETVASPPILKDKINANSSQKANGNASLDKYGNQNEDLKLISFPKIYYGTRTHKQVKQIVRELSKTAYNNVKMCILSSRENTCINPIVNSMPNRNEGCKDAIEKRECSFYCHASNLSHEVMADHTQGCRSGTWDLEDLVKVGKKIKSCPYYAIRKLMIQAKIIITPYNYIIDSVVRRSMDLNLKNAIVILDEAHNIEDAARESGSYQVSVLELSDCTRNLDEFFKYYNEDHQAKTVSKLFSGLCNFVNVNADDMNEYREFDSASKVFSGEEIVAVLSNIGGGPKDLGPHEKFVDKVLEEKSNDGDSLIFKPITPSIRILQSLLVVLRFLYKDNMKYVGDYRVVVTKSSKPSRLSNSGWRQKVPAGDSTNYIIDFTCLNSAVTFSEFSQDVFSIIVTSGTLSPMASFESELSVPFPIKLEANHVIKKAQVWVGTLGKSSKGSPLNGVYRVMETFDFQDEIGNLVLDVCRVVPYGVLCFFPSYSALSKLTNRWQETGLWSEFENLKVVVSEPRGGGRDNFDQILQEYYSGIEDGMGGLFFAVCRGKVSEGLDFADNNARAVITVGIPFPNFKSAQIDLKKKYNNSQASERSLMNGSEWYEVQAFRALNQALGRCIRHIEDWGALFIVDERFQSVPRYTNHLSKWVRQNIVHYQSYEQALTSLKEFSMSNMDNID